MSSTLFGMQAAASWLPLLILIPQQLTRQQDSHTPWCLHDQWMKICWILQQMKLSTLSSSEPAMPIRTRLPWRRTCGVWLMIYWLNSAREYICFWMILLTKYCHSRWSGVGQIMVMFQCVFATSEYRFCIIMTLNVATCFESNIIYLFLTTKIWVHSSLQLKLLSLTLLFSNKTTQKIYLLKRKSNMTKEILRRQSFGLGMETTA